MAQYGDKFRTGIPQNTMCLAGSQGPKADFKQGNAFWQA